MAERGNGFPKGTQGAVLEPKRELNLAPYLCFERAELPEEEPPTTSPNTGSSCSCSNRSFSPVSSSKLALSTSYSICSVAFLRSRSLSRFPASCIARSLRTPIAWLSFRAWMSAGSMLSLLPREFLIVDPPPGAPHSRRSWRARGRWLSPDRVGAWPSARLRCAESQILRAVTAGPPRRGVVGSPAPWLRVWPAPLPPGVWGRALALSPVRAGGLAWQ